MGLKGWDSFFLNACARNPQVTAQATTSEINVQDCRDMGGIVVAMWEVRGDGHMNFGRMRFSAGATGSGLYSIQTPCLMWRVWQLHPFVEPSSYMNEDRMQLFEEST